MINKLTKVQEKKMLKVRDEWLDRFFSTKKQTNKTQARKYINWLYEFSGLKKPIIVFLESPLGLQYGANMLKSIGESQVESQVWSQVRSQVRSQVESQVWSQVRSQVRSQVWSQVESQVESQVWSQVESQVWSQVESEKLTVESFTSCGSIWDYGWVAFYEYFQSIGVKFPKKLIENFNNFAFLLKSNVYDMIQLEGVCLVANMPSVIKRDSQNRLHSEDSPAIEWRDGYKLFLYHGICVPEKWITTPNKLTKKDWSSEENLEKRRVIQELMGEDFPKKLKARLIDKPSKEFKKHNLKGLYEVDLPNDPESVARYVKVQDHSSKREYYIRVKPSISDADEALAQTFGLSKEEYVLAQEA